MQKDNPTSHQRIRLWLIVSLGFISLLTAGCGEIFQFQTTSSNETSPPQETIQEPPISPAEVTYTPLSEGTSVPEHAPTVTLEDRPIETGISDDPFETPFLPTSDAPSSDGGLIDLSPNISAADILIMKPGHLSMVVSPFRLSAHLEPDPNNLIDIRLVGEDGGVIMEKSVRVFPWVGATTVTLVTLIEFELPPGKLAAARLELSTNDEFGRPRALNSIDLILMTDGIAMRNYTENVKEKVVIQYPLATTRVEGGTLLLSGLVKAYSEKPLSVELIDETGEVIGSTKAAVLLSGEDEYGLFAAEVAYEIDEPTWARLVIRVPGARIPGAAYIKTRELLLNP